jgi:putative tryptophan/tyrosine transport system substrate-binding protein
VRRAEFITLLGGATAAWPLTTRAQQAAVPLIGLLSASTLEADAFRLAAFRQGLGEAGYVEGHNVALEQRSADDHYDRLPALAAELVRSRVAILSPLAQLLRHLQPKLRLRLSLSSS